MIPFLRQQFNSNFTPEKYQRLLQLMAERCGTPVQFRICETPCFFPKSLLDRMAQCGKELIHQLETPEYRQASSAAIPGERKSGGAEGSWLEEFLRLSGCTVEQEPVDYPHAPFTDVNL